MRGTKPKIIQLKEQPAIILSEGQIAVIPKGVEHCPKSIEPSFILLFELWAYIQVYNSAYKSGYRDGVDKMVITIDSAFTKQNKNISNGMEK